MFTKKSFVGLLLFLATTIFPISMFAHGDEDAARYGQLQTIELPSAGKLGKYVKKGDANVKALKIIGELNSKDWDILYNLPNLAYLDLWSATNIDTQYEYKEGKEKISIPIRVEAVRFAGSNRKKYYSDFLLFFSPSLKYLVLPSTTNGIMENTRCSYSLDMLISFYCYKVRGKENALRFKNYTLRTNRNGVYADSRFLKDKIQIDTLNLASFDDQERALDVFEPAVIVHIPSGQKILNKYRGNEKVVDASMFDNITSNAFRGNTNIEKVVLNENIRELPNECFKDCRNLKEISMFPLTKFDHSVFEGTEIIDNFNFVYKLPADSLCLHISDISCTGVTKVDLSDHTYAPQLDLKPGKFERKHNLERSIIDDIKKSVEFIIPVGARKNRYVIGEWEKMHLTEQGSKDTYICELKTTGTLKDYITDDNAPNIKSLTVIGKMDETDVATLRKCISLKYLDISNCFVYQSEEHAKAIFTKEIEKLQMQYAMNKLRKEVYKQRYERAGQDLFNYASAETMDQYFQNLEIDKITQKDIDEYFHLLCGKEKVIKSDYCWFEKDGLYGLDWLEEVKLPNKYVGISYELWGTTKKRLKKVQLSPEIQYIGGYAFKGFSRLENINLPNSLQSIGSDAFKGCKLQKVDLTNTQIRTWAGGAGEQYLYLDAFEDNPLLEYRSPKNIENPQKWIETLKWTNTNQGCPITLYMNFKEPFCTATVLQQIFGEIKELHIPRGMKGAWRGYSNVIDDIDL